MNNETVKKAVALTMSTAMVTTMATGCIFSKSNRLVRYLNSNNYEKAISFYNEWEITEKEHNELVKALGEELDSIVTKYAAEKIDFEEATGIISTINTFGIYELTEPLAVTSATIYELKTSKEMYAQGMEAYENKDYPTTLRCLAGVIEKDKNYESARETFDKAEKEYIEEALKDAKKNAEEENYETAIFTLKECLKYVNDTQEVSTVLEEITEEYEEYKFELAKKELFDEVEKYKDRGDFEEAITYVNSFIDAYGSDDEVDNLQKSCKKDYVDMITNKVEVLRSEKKYLLAIEMLTNAMEIVQSDEFDDLMTVLEKEKPVYLCDLKYQTSNRYEQITEGETPIDTIGNTYEFGNTFEISSECGSWSNDNGYVDYYLGYKYSRLHGVIAVSDSSNNTSCTLTIEGDGKELYSMNINRLTTPTVINIDVSNVNYIKIKTGDAGSGTIYAILSDFYFDL
ncbi:MAG: NPCBM/NEW2 domain-containing protein [Clostridia bacterium]|nr:NPCBM/NEW2 domain-containing protein [Clostridia bacterium]